MGPALSAQYAAVFGRPWPVWGAAILVATVNVFLFAFDRPWTASDGLRNWGDWVLTGAGILRRPDLLPPWLYSGSLLNLGESVPGSVVDLSRVAEWCPACFDNGMPVRAVEGLDLYLALLNRAYGASPEQGARIRAAADTGRRVAGSAYLGVVVPEEAGVHNDLGIAYASRGQMDAAIAEFRQALALDPGAAATHWHLGAALAERGALDEAMEHLRTSVQRDPTNLEAKHDLETVTALRRQRQALP